MLHHLHDMQHSLHALRRIGTVCRPCFKKYTAVPVHCPEDCGCLTFVQDSGTKGACRGHLQVEKSVPHVLSVVLEATSTDHEAVVYQQVPLRTRSPQGTFRAGSPAKIDLAVAKHGNLLGIEVHGGKEHMSKRVTLNADSRKRTAWRALAKEGNHGCLLEVWGPWRGNQGESAWQEEVRIELLQLIADFLQSS